MGHRQPDRLRRGAPLAVRSALAPELGVLDDEEEGQIDPPPLGAQGGAADATDSPGKALLLVCLLLRRDEDGEPDPISLQELGALLRVTPSQRARYLRDWSAAGWPLCRRGLGSQGGGGRAPADQVAVWSLLPGEPVIV